MGCVCEVGIFAWVISHDVKSDSRAPEISYIHAITSVNLVSWIRFHHRTVKQPPLSNPARFYWPGWAGGSECFSLKHNAPILRRSITKSIITTFLASSALTNEPRAVKTSRPTSHAHTNRINHKRQCWIERCLLEFRLPVRNEPFHYHVSAKQKGSALLADEGLTWPVFLYAIVPWWTCPQSHTIYIMNG